MAVVPSGAQFRVLVVDDDKLIRKYILDLLSQIKDCSLSLFEARDGMSAMQLLEKNDIGIVLTDMRMSRMDGLTLIENAHVKWPWIQFIVLSNYDDFDYVRKSFLFGIVNYVLKYQITRELLEGLLTTAAASLFEYGQRQDYLHSIKKKSMYEDALLNGRQVEKSLNSCAPPPFLSNAGKPFFILRLDSINASETICDWQHSLSETWPCLFESNAKDAYFPFILPAQGGIARLQLGLIGWTQLTNLSAFKLSILERISQFFKAAEACGCICAAACEIHETFSAARLSKLDGMVEYLFYLDESVVIDASIENNDLFLQTDLFALFTNAILEGRKDDAAELIESTANKLLITRTEPMIAKKMMNRFLREMVNLGVAGAQNINSSAFEWLRTYKDALKKLILNMQQAPITVASGNEAIDRLIDQMLGNLSKPVTLDEAAGRIGFSRTHFCRIFKRATGESFNGFITRKRIEHACVLLRNPDAQLRTVAQTIGVSDVRYFKKLFEQHMHMSVSEWRKQQAKIIS